MAIAGAGFGAAQGLEQILAEQMVRAQLAQRQKEAEQQAAIQQQRLAQDAIEGNARIQQGQQQLELGERSRRDRSNIQGLELRDKDKAQMDREQIMGSLPPRLKQIADMRQVGVTGISPQDLQTPDETAAAQKTKDDADFAKWKRQQDYNENQIRTRPDKTKPPAASAKLPVGMATSIAAAKTSLAGLDKLESIYKDDMVGPIAGRYNKAERGAPAGLSGLMPDAPQGFEDFAAESATLKNQVIQAITGAAVGVKEQERIMAQIPDVTNSPANWKARAKATRRNLETLIANQTQMGTGATEATPGATVDAAPGAPKADLVWDGKKFVKPGGQ